MRALPTAAAVLLAATVPLGPAAASMAEDIRAFLAGPQVADWIEVAEVAELADGTIEIRGLMITAPPSDIVALAQLLDLGLDAPGALTFDDDTVLLSADAVRFDPAGLDSIATLPLAMPLGVEAEANMIAVGGLMVNLQPFAGIPEVETLQRYLGGVEAITGNISYVSEPAGDRGLVIRSVTDLDEIGAISLRVRVDTAMREVVDAELSLRDGAAHGMTGLGWYGARLMMETAMMFASAVSIDALAGTGAQDEESAAALAEAMAQMEAAQAEMAAEIEALPQDGVEGAARIAAWAAEMEEAAPAHAETLAAIRRFGETPGTLMIRIVPTGERLDGLGRPDTDVPAYRDPVLLAALIERLGLTITFEPAQ